MGQYFQPTNITKKKGIYPWSFDNGAKLMEWSYMLNQKALFFTQLLEKEWFNDKIVNCGDYADDMEQHWVDTENKNGKVSYQDLPENIKKLSSKNNEEYKKEITRYYKARVLVNFDKKEYTYFPEIKKDEYIVHPLPLLTANSNGCGGGDYTIENSMVGYWSYDSLGVFEKTSNEFEKIKNEFSDITEDTYFELNY